MAHRLSLVGFAQAETGSGPVLAAVEAAVSLAPKSDAVHNGSRSV